MEELKKYIDFAIDNGFKIKEGLHSNELRIHNDLTVYFVKNSSTYNIIEMITSKEFIEAIENGVRKNGYKEIAFGNLTDDITIKQAIAIRDGKLDEFINNIL